MRIRVIVGAIAAAAVVAAATLVVASRPDRLLQVTVLNTGSATAVLVRTGTGGTALVDGGASPTLLLAALGRVMPPASNHIDLVVLTGSDKASVDGLNGLPGHYSVGSVVTPGGLSPGADAVVAALARGGANVLDPDGAGWSFGGAIWHCLEFVSLTTAASMCALTVADQTGRLLILGGAGTADQEDLCAVFGTALSADVVVTPPGGAVSPVLLATARPREIAVPIAQGVPAPPAPAGYPIDRTGVDGDLAYAGGVSGLVARP